MTQGIGFGVAEALVENGCTVIISSSNPARVEKAVNQLKISYPSSSGRIFGYTCDLGDYNTLEANLKQLFEQTGPGKLDHIIHTAGDSLAMMKLDDIDIGKILKAGTVRFFAPLLIGKFAKQYLNPGPKSSIILTTGSVSEHPRENWSVINSFATGLQGMTRGLALDLKPIRVNLVSPGMVDTELWDGIEESRRREMFNAASARLPTGRVGRVEDVAESYLYLLKDENVTGSMISTNGGTLLV